MAAVPLVALLVAGSLWNGNWFTGGESPQGASAIGATPGEDGAARTRSIGPQHTDTAAEQNLQDAIAAAEAAHGRSDLAVARKLLDLATLYRAENRFREAQKLCERALIIEDQALGAKNPETLRTLNELAAIYRAEGRGKDADALLARVNQP
jgi:tetratricopeptide (TPR) repeat protein